MNAFRFLKNIKLVAVDELHYYSGTFGRLVFLSLSYPPTSATNFANSHVAQVLRRFRRICAAVGSGWFHQRGPSSADFVHFPDRRVRFVSCSATITNPGKYMRQMFGVDVCIPFLEFSRAH